MAQLVITSADAQLSRVPDLFMSHSSRDKAFARQLADDLRFCQVDVWFDEWELQPGESLHDRIGIALERSRFVGVVLAENFDDSAWARDELKQALARERRDQTVSVVPLIYGKPKIPAFLADKVHINFGGDRYPRYPAKEYFSGVFRLAALIHGISRRAADDAFQRRPEIESINQVIESLRYCGVSPYVKVGQEDYDAIRAAGGKEGPDGKIRFNPKVVGQSKHASPRLQALMSRLTYEVWYDRK
jgi:hypothetical protein